MIKILIIPGLLLLLNGYTHSDLFTSVAHLEGVLQTETVLLRTLEKYIHEEEQKLVLIKEYYERSQSQRKMVDEDVQKYLGNPLDAYLLIKRLTKDWKQIENLMSRNLGEELLKNFLSEYSDVLKFPADEDLNGAAVALTRLQDTYNLDTTSLASGEINGIKYTSEFTAADCFELGRQCYNNEDYHFTHLWMTEASDRLTREANQTIERSDILEYLVNTMLKLGDAALALNLTNKILELSPNHQIALDNKARLESETFKSQTNKTSQDDGEPEQTDAYTYYRQQMRPLYQQVCRGDLSTPEAVLTQLRCRYVDNNNPVLKIGPFKMEEAYTTPKIVIFHDVISDEEIATLKQLAHPRLVRGKVINPATRKSETVPFRTSQSAYLLRTEHPHVAAIVQRVEDMTGLNMETAEVLQVAYYGIGGHYEPHYDFFREHEKRNDTRNRIATMLFYMSDVSQGGATVFPYIKLALWPKKGAAAFWYNLHSSGEGDKMTAHAACPVLVGSKWVSSQWISERGQEFRKPCDLKRPPSDLTI